MLTKPAAAAAASASETGADAAAAAASSAAAASAAATSTPACAAPVSAAAGSAASTSANSVVMRDCSGGGIPVEAAAECGGGIAASTCRITLVSACRSRSFSCFSASKALSRSELSAVSLALAVTARASALAPAFSSAIACMREGPTEMPTRRVG